MDGTLDIQRLSNSGSGIEIFQVRYEDLIGEAFEASMDKEELHDLLYRKLALDLTPEQLDGSMELLNREGRVIVPEIEIRPEELAGAGLKFTEVEG